MREGESLDERLRKELLRSELKERNNGKKIIRCKYRPKYPDSAEREYVRLINAYMTIEKEVLMKYIPEIKQILNDGTQLHTDSKKDNEKKRRTARFSALDNTIVRLTILFKTIQRELDSAFGLYDLKRQINRIANLDHKLTVREWKKAVSKTLGIDLLDDYYSGEYYAQMLEKWVSDNECIKNIIINPEITVQAVGQIVDNYNCDEEIEFNVSKLPEDKIYVLIRKHYIRYSLSNTEKIKSNAIDGFGIYCREYIDQFINDLPSVSLNESEVVMLLNDTTIDKHFKPEILKKISAGIMTKKLAQTIASNQFDVDKVYVERAWKFLDNTERHMLLVYHLQVYSVAEISRLLMELGGEWSKLSDNKSRHKEEISIDVNGHNERLLLQLQKKGFITSYQEKNDRKKRCFEVWVKQQ